MNTFFTVHAVAKNDRGEYLLLQRAAHRQRPLQWNVVTGHIQDRESAEAGALRELKEETNLEGEIIKTSEPYWSDDVDGNRWVRVASLIEVKDLSLFKLDTNESQAFKWVTLDDPLIKETENIQRTFKKLEIL